MKMTRPMARMHFQERPPGGARSALLCGRWDGYATKTIANVTCKICLKMLWREVALAHFRAFGAGGTELGRRLRGAMREAEIATRTSPTAK